MIDNLTGNPRVRRGMYIFLGILALIMIGLSFVQLWVLFSTSDMTAYGSVAADANGYPANDQRGAFIVLNDEHNPIYQGNLIDLLATTEPGVVDTTQGAHLRAAEIKAILVQSSALNEPADYRVYRIGEQDAVAVKVENQTGGKVLLITPQDGVWPPGPYMLDVPADGMFGGRTYYQFFVDPDK